MSDSDSSREVGVDPLPLDLAAIRAEHRAVPEFDNPDAIVCNVCYDDWPCATEQAARAVECLRTENAALLAALQEIADYGTIEGRASENFYLDSAERDFNDAVTIASNAISGREV